MARFEISKVIHKPDIRGTISLFGRMLITLGLILLLFVAYQLWGTNFAEGRSQDSLRDKFNSKIADAKKNTTTTTGPNTQTTGPDGKPISQDDEAIKNLKQEVVKGEPIAFIVIPKIGLNHVVVSGTDRSNLKKGPGHYPATPLPGQLGNSAIAGHRTTYGSPFSRLDELAIGDKISLETVRGTFTYEVSEDYSIVSPKDVSVIAPTVDKSDPTGKTLLPTLTLTTCHPKYSAAKRLIIKAKLVDEDLDKATEASQLFDETGKVPAVIDVGEDGVIDDAGTSHSNILVAMFLESIQLPLLWWLLLLITVGSIWWYFFKKFHNWKIWIAGALPFAVALLFYFINLEAALPAGI